MSQSVYKEGSLNYRNISDCSHRAIVYAIAIVSTVLWVHSMTNIFTVSIDAKMCALPKNVSAICLNEFVNANA